ncbi:hypothetical protein [Tichowtungia aerotolerans]|uniref:Uncharacterized protein n=1 Tax=Tichowtungia aerotolerans TaxID=2697043 RepID=A0A6P1M4A6_9BACT|nr:hypothetical protein [Tichowtungia aerotolerans]QHI68671.1 hypothetical protein GT409_04150 [Tichowtungia aerotolerans]
MKIYLKTLRWCIGAAVLLPLILAVPKIYPQLYLLMNPLVYFCAYIALFIWAGAKASQANYSIIHSAFAGTAVLLVSQIVNTPLRFIFSATAATETRPPWGIAIHASLQSILVFCFCFPIALGFSALGAYLNSGKTKNSNQKVELTENPGGDF